MVDQNAEFDGLEAAVQAFCYKERSIAKGAAPDRTIATKLRSLFNQVCPRLSLKFQNASDVVYARKIIDDGVNGLNDPVQKSIWELYFKLGSTLAELEDTIDRAPRTTKRLINVFAYKVSVQLFEKELEITGPVQTETAAQRAKRFLQDKFDLSSKQAEVLLAFCLHADLSQNEICGQILFIAENTLKVYKRRILKRTGSKSMKEAVGKGIIALKETNGDDWYKL